MFDHRVEHPRIVGWDVQNRAPVGGFVVDSHQLRSGALRLGPPGTRRIVEIEDRRPLELRETPDILVSTRDRRRDAGALALKNLRAFLSGEPLDAVVNLEVYDRSS